MKFKPNFKKDWFIILAILIMVGVGIYTYPNLPDMVPSHWNIKGEIDDYLPKLTHSILFPAMTLGLYLLFLALPYIEPRRKHFLESWGFYQIIKNLIVGFMLVLFVTTSWSAAASQPLEINMIVPISVGVLFIIIGNYMSQIKSNFFMGIRTPWTLSSDTVWQKTHRLGGVTFVIAGLSFLASPLFADPLNFVIPMSATLAAALIPVVYSYILFVQEQKK